MTLHTPQPHLMLVEDEAHVYQTLFRRLQAENYRVTLATTYAQARELLAVQRFHLAIFDMNLDSADEADRSGYQLLKEIADLDLAGVMPCIIVTAYGTMSMAIEAADVLTQVQAGIIVEAALRSIVSALQGGQEVEIRGFGSFRFRNRAPRKGRNPKTGEKVDVPPKKIPYFKMGKELKALLNSVAGDETPAAAPEGP